MRRWVAVSMLVGVLTLCAGASHADWPVLHEFIEANPAEDLEVGATTPDGRMPAAARTPSGLISAPGFDASDAPAQLAYGGTSTPDSLDATYRIDRDTTQPTFVRYDDPFTPAVSPFKRLYAFDAVDGDLELLVRDKKLQPVTIGGSLGRGEDRFFGDLFVDINQGVPVRIPTVAPGTRVLGLRVEPPTPIELVRDGADNLFAIGRERRRVRLILELGAPRAAFTGEIADVSYDALAPWVPALPEAASAAAEEVLGLLGVSRALSPREALSVLVAHFRDFSPSGDLPRASAGPALYRELSLAKKGVCRHRAYAFVVTALGLGLPARFVRNEAHAWVEVGDGQAWHRIDLGGAAGRFEVDTAAGAPAHAVPPDPFPWPEGARSAAQAMDESSATGDQPGDGTAPGAGQGSGASPAPSAFPPPPPPLLPSRATALEPSAVELSVESRSIRRGVPLEVRGKVTETDGEACPHARVDLALVGHAGQTLLGSLPTDDEGRYQGAVTIPFDLDVGEYQVRASTPGALSCGPSVE